MMGNLKLKFEHSQSIIVAALTVGFIGIPQVAFAQETGGAFGPIQAAVQLVIDFVTGPFGRALAVLAVIGLGIAAFAGKISWIACGFVVIGIGLVFGAPQIVDQLISSVGS